MQGYGEPRSKPIMASLLRTAGVREKALMVDGVNIQANVSMLDAYGKPWNADSRTRSWRRVSS